VYIALAEINHPRGGITFTSNRAMGCWPVACMNLKPSELTAFRDAISRDACEFKTIIFEKKFVEYFGGVNGDSSKTIPRGYAVDHPDAVLLRLKTVIVTHKVTDEAATAPGFYGHVLDAFGVMKPFRQYPDRFV